jgi:IS4 transposase
VAPSLPDIKESQLRSWKLLAAFKERLAKVWPQTPRHPTWADPQRLLRAEDYLCLFLFGLLNPVVRTTRGLCAASQLARVRQEVCACSVSLGSFSEAQHLVDPVVLEKVFQGLAQELPGRDETKRHWLIQDSSLFNALPRMHWALWRRQGKKQAQVRLHLSLDSVDESPARAEITTGRGCERAAWEREVRPGDGYVADRYYSENYQLLQRLGQRGVAFVVRLREAAVMEVEQELRCTERDRKAQVLDDAWVRLGCKTRYRIGGLRLVRVQTAKEVLLLLTNLGPDELSAAQVALLYKERWKVELFFRWIKYILGCRHWLAESAPGAEIELYLALIAGLLLHLYSSQKPNRRMMELLQFYALGMATIEELEAGLAREKLRQAASPKKS